MDIVDFVRESNAIEGIHRDVTEAECKIVGWFLDLDKLTISDIVHAVEVFQPDARLRDRVGMNVRVGHHTPPGGGRHIETELMSLLARISAKHPYPSPYDAHCRYETLHPFTDGNGRSGRLLWLWMMKRRLGEMPRLSFLHCWYYDSLATSR